MNGSTSTSTVFLLLRDDVIMETRADLEAESTDVLGVFTEKEAADLARAETRAALIAGRAEESQITVEEAAHEVDDYTSFRVQEHNLNPTAIDTEFGPVSWVDAVPSVNAIVHTT